MKKRLLSLFFVLVFTALVFMPAVHAAGESDTYMFTVDVNERYTDISYVDSEGNLTSDEDEAKDDASKNTYVAVLSVLLVISIIVLIVSLRKARVKGNADVAEVEKEGAQEKESVKETAEVPKRLNKRKKEKRETDVGSVDGSNVELKDEMKDERDNGSFDEPEEEGKK